VPFVTSLYDEHPLIVVEQIKGIQRRRVMAGKKHLPRPYTQIFFARRIRYLDDGLQ